MTKPRTTILVAAAGAMGVAGATSFLIGSSHQADDQACRQDAQGHPAVAAGTRPGDPQNRKPEECDPRQHHAYHASGGGAFFTPTGNRGRDDDDAPRSGRAGGSGGEAESAGHAGFGASAAGHGGGGE
ncbi:hypothetical protein ACMAUO_03860 [Gluconacetobacter sp. Hr-1-5]|uniref:hypothetical protein n=1 Tax=Gluconacetobacter sp. Hr-1-5 TaxID=3395370 RepID=UPI003B530522